MLHVKTIYFTLVCLPAVVDISQWYCLPSLAVSHFHYVRWQNNPEKIVAIFFFMVSLESCGLQQINKGV